MSNKEEDKATREGKRLVLVSCSFKAGQEPVTGTGTATSLPQTETCYSQPGHMFEDYVQSLACTDERDLTVPSPKPIKASPPKTPIEYHIDMLEIYSELKDPDIAGHLTHARQMFHKMLRLTHGSLYPQLSFYSNDIIESGSQHQQLMHHAAEELAAEAVSKDYDFHT